MNRLPPTRRKLLSREIVPVNNLAVGIARGSTLAQLNTLGAQTLGIERFCAMRNLDVAGRIITDNGTSTSIPFFQREKVREALRLMADIGSQQLVLTRTNRAFRSLADQSVCLLKLAEAGVIVHFTEQDVPKPTSASGVFMLNVLGAQAEMAKALTRENQIEANEIQRMRGHRCGVNAPYGWRFVRDGSGRKTKAGSDGWLLEPVPEQQEVLREIIRRHEDGQSDEFIAAVLNAAKIPTAKAGQDIKYRGKIRPCSGKWRAGTVFSVRSFAREMTPSEFTIT
jgi:DNA invertase Pin-like site-specific DNA recombinase